MERGARRATVLGITESDMTERLSTAQQQDAYFYFNNFCS